MSADVLRRAAALMREVAEGATPGVWDEYGAASEDGTQRWNSIGVERDPELEIARLPWSPTGSCDMAHIASWHPAVALAVADWLDATAAEHESDAADPRVNAFFAEFDTAPDMAAITVARAYLGETP